MPRMQAKYPQQGTITRGGQSKNSRTRAHCGNYGSLTTTGAVFRCSVT